MDASSSADSGFYLLTLLPIADWLALGFFFAVWLGYAWFAKAKGGQQASLLDVTNRYRRYWLEQASARDPRMLDGIITQNLSNTPAFFSSTSILVIGALLALLGTMDKAAELVKEIPFAQATTVVVFEIKVLALISVFVYAFFRFSWCMRQYTFVALVIGSMPPPAEFDSGRFEREKFVKRGATLVGAAAETFNDGLRAYYFSFALLCWFISPLALAIGAAGVVAVLYRREFHSQVLQVLRD